MAQYKYQMLESPDGLVGLSDGPVGSPDGPIVSPDGPVGLPNGCNVARWPALYDRHMIQSLLTEVTLVT